jgi:hypothetical protein
MPYSFGQAALRQSVEAGPFHQVNVAMSPKSLPCFLAFKQIGIKIENSRDVRLHCEVELFP